MKKSLNIWVLQDGETLPTVPGSKKMRSWLLGEELAARGHDVLWWASTISHMEKKRVGHDREIIQVSDRLRMLMLEAGSYHSNISLARLRYQQKLGQRFLEECDNHSKPDVIIASFPSIELTYEATRWAKQHNIPVVVDIRDMWPDTYANYFPRIFSPLIRLMTTPLRRKAYFAFKECDKLIAVSKDMLRWGLARAGRAQDGNARVLYLGCEPYDKTAVQSSPLIDKLKAELKGKVCLGFIGTFGYSYDLMTVCKAAKKLHEQGEEQFHFLFIGDGVQYQKVAKLTKELPNVTMTGWLQKDDLHAAISLIDAGLVLNDMEAIPNKIFDYCSAGIPMLSCLRGEGAELLNERHAGKLYPAKNVEQFMLSLEAFRDEKERIRMGEAAYKLFERDLMGKTTYPEYADFVEQAGAGK